MLKDDDQPDLEDQLILEPTSAFALNLRAAVDTLKPARQAHHQQFCSHCHAADSASAAPTHTRVCVVCVCVRASDRWSCLAPLEACWKAHNKLLSLQKSACRWSALRRDLGPCSGFCSHHRVEEAEKGKRGGKIPTVWSAGQELWMDAGFIFSICVMES